MSSGQIGGGGARERERERERVGSIFPQSVNTGETLMTRCGVCVTLYRDDQ